MAKNLVIVESPAKARTINKYLGKDFVVKSSVGHIRDLPSSASSVAESPAAKAAKTSKGTKAVDKEVRAWAALVRRMGVDPRNGWQARYEVLPGKEKVLAELRTAAEDAPTVYLATDLDREGEAIAWHLREVIGGPAEKFRRVTFSEITRPAIQAAFERPGDINAARVDAQQARRFLDRVVGFMVSPLLWKKVARGLSAGRVQSVATRLVVEREREVKAFVPEEYWEVAADLDGGRRFRAQVARHRDQAFKPVTVAQAEQAVSELRGASYRVRAREDKPVRQAAKAPFITSTLQQAASTRLGFGVKKTMTLAQRLYEAGFITYMRTDSTALSADAVSACRAYIGSSYGERYLPAQPQVYGSREGAQEAHEAIRPSDLRQDPSSIELPDRDQQRLYDLIWRQFVACQMPPAEYDTTAVAIAAGDYELRARGRVLRFDGWLKVMPPAKAEGEEAELPDLRVEQELRLVELLPTQHFTKPPPRFSEAALVRELEKRGIGRPSTYAAVISTIQDRGYVRLENRRLYAEKMGEIVTERLVESFRDILDYGFTAGLEEKLDRIAVGELDWRGVLDAFFAEFSAELKRAEVAGAEGMRPNTPTPTDISCPTCGRSMQVRTARTGVFLGCSGYDLPKAERCTTTLNLVRGDQAETVRITRDVEDGAAESAELRQMRRCPLCGAAMDAWLLDEQRRLHICSRNPDCPGLEVEQGSFRLKGYEGPEIPCDKCGSPMQLKTGRFGKYFGCTNTACKNTRKLLRNGQPAPPKMDPIPFPELRCSKGDDHFVLRDGASGLFLSAASYPRLRETRNPTVAELASVAERLPEKYRHLAAGPQQDPEGRSVVVRFSRKAGEQYLASEKDDGKASGWTAFWRDGHWLPAKH